jgi:hypothetical protein
VAPAIGGFACAADSPTAAERTTNAEIASHLNFTLPIFFLPFST